LSVTKTVWKNILRVLGSSGKVLEFRVSNIVGTLNIHITDNWAYKYNCKNDNKRNVKLT